MVEERARREDDARRKGRSAAAREARAAEQDMDEAKKGLVDAAAAYFGGTADREAARRGYHDALEREEMAAARLAEAERALARRREAGTARKRPTSGNLRGEARQRERSEG